MDREPAIRFHEVVKTDGSAYNDSELSKGLTMKQLVYAKSDQPRRCLCPALHTNKPVFSRLTFTMKTSIIRQRVADFLKQYAPFDLLPESDLLELAGSGKVKFHESEEYLFRSGDPKGQFVWMIQQGRVDLLDESSSVERLLDVLGVGDLLGIEPFAGDGFSHAGARTATDVILYGFSMDLFETLSKRHSSVRRFLTAYSSISGKLRANKTSWLDADAPPIEYLRSRLLVLPQNVSTRDAASSLIDSSKVVAAFVNESGCLIGTITALELLVASSDSACAAAARHCPPTISPLLSTRSIVRKMLHSRGDQVAITTDGTAERHFGLTLRNRWLDTMDLTLHLDDDGAFGARPMSGGFSLDGLCEMFGVAPHDRHTAGGDAFLTAQIFLRLLRAAKAAGRDTLGALCQPYPHA